MILVPRATVFGPGLPTSSTGTPRPLLDPDRPWLVVHYTGAGWWLDPDDTPTELRQIQVYAKSAGKPWEYNYVIDGQGLVFEYAGLYRAAHAGTPANELGFGVLLLLGFHGTYPNVIAWEEPTDEMIQAFRELRHWLTATGHLAADHDVLAHRQVPGAATICPGPAVVRRWDEFTTPWADPDPQPPVEDDDMTAFTRWRHEEYTNVFLIPPGSRVSGALNVSLEARGVPLIVDRDELTLDMCLAASAMAHSDLAPVNR